MQAGPVRDHGFAVIRRKLGDVEPAMEKFGFSHMAPGAFLLLLKGM